MKEGYVRQAQADKQKWQEEEQKLSQQVLQQKKLVEQWRGESIAAGACQHAGYCTGQSVGNVVPVYMQIHVTLHSAEPPVCYVPCAQGCDDKARCQQAAVVVHVGAGSEGRDFACSQEGESGGL